MPSDLTSDAIEELVDPETDSGSHEEQCELDGDAQNKHAAVDAVNLHRRADALKRLPAVELDDALIEIQPGYTSENTLINFQVKMPEMMRATPFSAKLGNSILREVISNASLHQCCVTTYLARSCQ